MALPLVAGAAALVLWIITHNPIALAIAIGLGAGSAIAWWLKER